MFKEIVVAFDGSDHAERAVRMACDIARHYDSNLHLVHVPQLYDQAFAVGYTVVDLPVREESLQESGAAMIKLGEEIAADARGSFASTSILAGPPVDAILKLADQKGADLIVLGRRGLGAIGGVFLGSVSQSLAAHANSAVLTVK